MKLLQRPTKSRIFDWVAIALLGLLIQGFWAWQVTEPTYMDAYYYTTNGQRLASGAGFSELVIWQYLDLPQGLPNPSHTYWLPLPSILAAAGYRLVGEFTGAKLFFWLLAGTLPLLAYSISGHLAAERWQGWAAAMFTAAGSFYAAYLSQPTTFAPFAWAGGLGLLVMVWAGRNRAAGPWLLVGILAGLAHLTRADGLLLLLVAIVYWALSMRGRPSADRLPEALSRRGILFLGLIFAGYMLVMGGWFLRNLSVMDRPLSSAGSQSMFLIDYDDLFAYGRTFNLGTFLDWGWANIIRSKLLGVWSAVQTLIAIPGLIFLTPFIAVAWITYLRRPESRALLTPLSWYAVTLFVGLSLVFTYPGIRGSLFHSSVALWPWSTALAAAGIGLTVDWMAKRLPHWRPQRAKRLFSALFILIALALSWSVSLPRASAGDVGWRFQQLSRQIPPGSIVMVGNAPALYYYTGLASLSVPNEPANVVLQAADRFGATYMILDENRPQPLDQLYEGQVQHPRIQLRETLDEMKLYEFVGPPN